MNKPAVLIVLGAVLLLAVGTSWIARAPDEAVEPAGAPLPIPPLPPRLAESDRYDRCLATVGDDPARAAIEAEAWWREGAEPAARHCLALAQLGLGHPDQAAALLGALAAAAAPAPVRATMFEQASQAWRLAGNPAGAYDAATQALALAPDNPDVWQDRAAASLARQQFQPAIDDLTQALARDAARTDILVQRAAALRMAGRLDAALTDIERALTADPNNAEALLERGVLRQRRDDFEGARQDWDRVIAVAADTQAADLATQDLALLDAGPRQ